MREEYLIDALADYQVEPDDPTRSVPNPAWKELDKQLHLARTHLRKLQKSYGCSVLDSLGVERWRAEGVRPVGGLYPTNAWRPGERLTDYHSLVVPPYLWGGQCELQVALYPPLGEEDQ